jgi:hypothetical protein
MSVLLPAFAMMALTFICLGRMGYLRAVAVKSGEIDPRFFRLYRGYEEPEKLAAHSRHIVNHFETPVLFYVLCLIAFVTDQVSAVIIGLAWVYVGLRCIHSYVHLTSNAVLLRFRVFVVSLIILGILWATLLVEIVQNLG